MSLSLDEKTALITGGSRGIGRAIAERLAADGAAIVINYARSERLAQEVVKAITAKGGKAIGIQADLSKPAEVRRLFSEADKAMGGLDIVVANAGVHIEKPLIENTEADYDYIFDTNTRGVFGKLLDGPFTAEIKRHVGEMHFRAAGRNDDNAATLARPAAGLLQCEKDPPRIRVENVIVIRLGVFDQRFFNMDAGVGNDDVEAAHRFLGFAEQSPHLRGFRKVSLNPYGFTALRRDRLDDLLRQ